MSPFRTVALATVLCSAAALPLSAAQSCLTPSEVHAAQLRQLHVQLQVAAINCRHLDPSISGKYASYVDRFGSVLNSNAKVLTAYFDRAHSGAARTQFDRYVTVLANEESQRVHKAPGYCEAHAPVFDRVLSLKPSDIDRYAIEAVARPSVLHACPEPTKAAEAAPPAKPRKVAAKHGE